MSLYDMPNLTSGIDDALIGTANSVPAFPIMILVFIFCIVWIGGTSNQKRRLGSADYPFWTVLSSVSTTFMAVIFTLGDGLINLTTLGIIIAVTILSAVWFFMSSVRGEIKQ